MTKADRLTKIARRARYLERAETKRSQFAQYLGADDGAFVEISGMRDDLERLKRDMRYAASNLLFASQPVRPFWLGRW